MANPADRKESAGTSGLAGVAPPHISRDGMKGNQSPHFAFVTSKKPLACFTFTQLLT